MNRYLLPSDFDTGQECTDNTEIKSR